MTSRNVPTSVMEDLNRTSSPNALLWFLTIAHADLSATVRLVADHFDYVLNGETYVGLPFEPRPMTDTDGAPYAQIVVSNIDARVSRELEAAKGRAEISIEAYSSDEFDETQSPRTPIGTPEKVYSFTQFQLVQVSVDNRSISGRIGLPDYAGEPYPPLRITQDLFPAMFI